VTCATFLFWRRALRAQNISLDSLPYKSILQPGAAYVGMICTLVMAFVGGYTVFLPGQWDVPTFLFSYFIKRSKVRKAEEVDLRGEVGEIEEYTRSYVPVPPRYVLPCSFL
jgi:amino acid transporter